MKKIQSIIIFAVIVIVAVIGIYLGHKSKNKNNLGLLPSSSVSVNPAQSQSLVASASPIASASPSPTAKFKPTSPTPAMSAGERGDFMYWAKLLDPLHKYFLVNEDCTSINPSIVSFPNNTQILLANSNSYDSRTIKIGTQTYVLEPRDWRLITLKSATLPASLPIYCGSMELGRIDLVK